MALSGAVLRIVERRIVVPIQKKVVEQSDLFRAEQRCIDAYGGGQDEVVDILPVRLCDRPRGNDRRSAG